MAHVPAQFDALSMLPCRESEGRLTNVAKSDTRAMGITTRQSFDDYE